MKYGFIIIALFFLTVSQGYAGHDRVFLDSNRHISQQIIFTIDPVLTKATQQNLVLGYIKEFYRGHAHLYDVNLMIYLMIEKAEITELSSADLTSKDYLTEQTGEQTLTLDRARLKIIDFIKKGKSTDCARYYWVHITDDSQYLEAKKQAEKTQADDKINYQIVVVRERQDNQEKHNERIDAEHCAVSDSNQFYHCMASMLMGDSSAIQLQGAEQINYKGMRLATVFNPSYKPNWVGGIKKNRDANFSNASDYYLGGTNHHGYERKLYTDALPDGVYISNVSDFLNTLENSYHQEMDSKLPFGHQLDSSEKNKVLSWFSGNYDHGKYLENWAGAPDVIHSNPVIVTYNENNQPQEVLYYADNAGFINAYSINGTPKELVSFIPQELLSNLPSYWSSRSRYQKTYGLDGKLTYYHAKLLENEVKYLAFGMRRGGSNYYLLDISKMSRPRLVSKIEGGKPGFEELGETWSKMKHADVYWSGKKIPVLFFGGGYDANDQAQLLRVPNQYGNAIYMVTADNTLTGKPFDLLWKVSGHASNNTLTHSQMTSSFTADLSLIDDDGDGTVDIIYAADVGGRIWRIDINKHNQGLKDFAEVSVLADFNQQTKQENIRFFSTPDVIFNQSEKVYQLSIGSGFDLDPFNTTIKDKLFVISDFDSRLNTEKPLTIEHLTSYQQQAQIRDGKRVHGFYYEFTEAGEKVLSSSMTVNHSTYITTFRPDQQAIQQCGVNLGNSRLLIFKSENKSNSTKRLVVKELDYAGIAPAPALTIPSNKEENDIWAEVIVGEEVVDVIEAPAMKKQQFWKKITAY